MRAICDTCEAAQPADWKPGDLCTSCGQIARREKRCHWCAGWTPEGKFCRGCGSATVDDEHYAAARMLKAAGVDQFALPERLGALESDHRDHLTRMYQRQAARVARVVDDVAFVESELRTQGWSVEIDDELIGRLPLPDDELDASVGPISKGPAVTFDAVARLQQLCNAAPIELLRELAGVALVRSGAINDSEQADTARRALYADDIRLRDEAALAFSGWRAQSLPVGLARDNEIIDALLVCTRADEAAVGLRMMGEEAKLSPLVLASTDPDLAFSVALVTGRVESLVAALGDPQRRFAAARSLARHGHGDRLRTHLNELDDDQLMAVLDTLQRRDEPIPALHDELFAIADRAGNDDRLRYRTADLVVREHRPEDALRLLRIDPTDSSVAQLVLQQMHLPAGELDAVARHLVEHGRFGAHQYGVEDLADSARLRDDFVPTLWPHVVDEERACNLLRFAERQLGARGDDALHRFVLGVVFGDRTERVRSESWWVLRRWYAQTKYAWTGPLVFEADAIQTWFGPVPTFLERVAAFLRSPDASGDLTLQEKVAELLRYAEPEHVAAIAVAHDDAFCRFVEGFPVVLRDASIRLDLRSAVVRFYEHMSRLDAWLPTVLAELTHPAEGDGDMAFECSETRRRILERSA